MSHAFQLTRVLMGSLYRFLNAPEARLGPFYPKIHGVPKVVVRHVLIGLIFMHRNGLRLFYAAKVYGPPTTLDNRLMR